MKVRKGSVTVHDVAKRAGVSIATVSRVVGGTNHVAPETRRRVLQAIAELGYRPSHFGRALVSQRHAALGIVFSGLSGPYYSDVIYGFEAVAVAARQSVLLLGTHLLQQSDEQVLEIATRVDGLAIQGGAIADATVARIIAAEIPVVLFARRPLDGIPTVRAENVTATVDLVLHLIETHGHERLAFVGTPEGSPDVTDRWNGFLEAHRRMGITPPSDPVRVALGYEDGLRAAAQLLAMPDRPQAVVCANDETALGLLSGAASRGLRVPHDLAVTGWDDTPAASLVSPSLTTVRQPVRQLGTRTAELLLGRISGELRDAPDVVLPTELVVRATCGCASDLSASTVEPMLRSAV